MDRIAFRARMIDDLALRGRQIDRTADHAARNFGDIRFACRGILDHDAVAHDDDLVAHGEDLLQAVGDKDDGNTARCHRADGVKQRCRFLLGQNRGRLVENEKLEVVFTQLTGDFRKLLMADRHVADDHMLIDVNAHFLDGFRRAFIHLLIIEGIETVAEDLGDHVGSSSARG